MKKQGPVPGKISKWRSDVGWMSNMPFHILAREGRAVFFVSLFKIEGAKVTVNIFMEATHHGLQ
jgi:hypothetical protein